MTKQYRKNFHPYPSEFCFIEKIKTGDSAALVLVHSQLFDPLIRSAQSLVKSFTDSEDIVSHAFLKFFAKGCKDMESLEHIRRWFHIAVRNESLNLLRNKRRERLAKWGIGYQHQDKEEQEEGAEITNYLLHCQAIRELAKLPPQARTVLQLYFIEQKSTKQIATMLNLRHQTVLNHKTKGLRALRKRVSAQVPRFR